MTFAVLLQSCVDDKLSGGFHGMLLLPLEHIHVVRQTTTTPDVLL